MIVSGFALISPDQQEIAWWEHIPGRINIPEIGAVIFAAEAGWSQYGYEIVSADREFADPAPVRRLIPKWKVLERITDEQLEQAMSLMTLRQAERWRMPGSPDVYVDDPDLVMLLNAIGADVDVVLAEYDQPEEAP